MAPRPIVKSGMEIGMRTDWEDWNSLAIRVYDLPQTTHIADVWSHFRAFGNVIYAGFDRGRHSATIRFSPPPSQSCWGYIKVRIQGKLYTLQAKQLESDTRVWISPHGEAYPPYIRLEPTLLRFGVLEQEKQFVALRTCLCPADGRCSLLLDLFKKVLELHFVCSIPDPRRADKTLVHSSPIRKLEKTTEYKASISLSQITKIALVDNDRDDTFSVVIPLQTPPAVWQRSDVALSLDTTRDSLDDKDTWKRTADITYDTAWSKRDKTSLRGYNYQFIDVGKWTTYKIEVTKSPAALKKWESMRKALEDLNILVKTFGDDFHTVEPKENERKDKLFWDLFEPKVAATPSASLALLADTDEVNLPFEVRYQLEVCISQGYFNELKLDIDFLRKLNDLSNNSTGRRNRAKDLLIYVAESDGPWDMDRSRFFPKRFYDPVALFEDKTALSHYPEIGVPAEHCTWVRKVTVTPTTIYVSSPTPEPSNRVLRQYPNHADHFLRVQFLDEIVKGKIHASPDSIRDDALFTRIWRTLLNGIEVGGRHYEFLACGNSQFRENGAWFFHSTDHLTCDQIRKWMGAVDHIRNVAKYAARLGQCFSTTRAPRDIPISKRVIEIPDITHNGWCFTDGVGKIAETLADFLARHLRLNTRSVPSAFQFRLGGSKGLLVVDPGLRFNEVMIRPSQKKFEAVSDVLEIIKHSRYSVATLNRQTIPILSCLGVEDDVFLRMQAKQMRDYDLAMNDPSVALQLLNRLVDQNGVTTTMAQMIANGFMQAKEPFLMCLLQTWRAWSLRLLREKARIVVEKSAMVFGCVDETNTLRGHREVAIDGSQGVSSSEKTKEDLPQIFLQVPQLDAPPGYQVSYVTITGLCVVGRNPSLHPGDIRVVEAVDVPALHHIRDVVVFPANGDQDIPSMCSGGDLDGDDFFVIWDPELIPPERNFPPMIHDPLEPVLLEREVTVTDLIRFFVNYMKNDRLADIALAWMALADQLPDGPKHPRCLKVAQLHSHAVDYNKSGRPAHLDARLRPKKRPHFMDPRGYKSRSALGQLYDVVAPCAFQWSVENTFDERILRRYHLTAKTLRKARILKVQHDKALRKIMNQREIETEFEVWSTFVLTKPRLGTDYKLQETMGPIVATHRDRFRNACIRVAGSRDARVLYPFIAALYRVTWEEVSVHFLSRDDRERHAQHLAPPMISFPWIFDLELGRIAMLETQYELDSMPEITGDAFDGEQQTDDYELLLDTGVFDAKMENIEAKQENPQGRPAEPKTSLPEPLPETADETPSRELDAEEEVLIEEIETGVDALLKLASD